MQLSAIGLGAGAGMYMMEADQLARYREAVVEETSGAELAAIADEAHRAGIEVAGHDKLKTAPKGYSRDHPRIELLRYKGVVAWNEWPAGAWLGTSRAKDRVVQFFRASQPLCDWLAAHVGSTVVER